MVIGRGLWPPRLAGARPRPAGLPGGSAAFRGFSPRATFRRPLGPWTDDVPEVVAVATSGPEGRRTVAVGVSPRSRPPHRDKPQRGAGDCRSCRPPPGRGRIAPTTRRGGGHHFRSPAGIALAAAPKETRERRNVPRFRNWKCTRSREKGRNEACADHSHRLLAGNVIIVLPSSPTRLPEIAAQQRGRCRQVCGSWRQQSHKAARGYGNARSVPRWHLRDAEYAWMGDTRACWTRQDLERAREMVCYAPPRSPSPCCPLCVCLRL